MIPPIFLNGSNNDVSNIEDIEDITFLLFSLIGKSPNLLRAFCISFDKFKKNILLSSSFE